jgi:hypothetical protein
MQAMEFLRNFFTKGLEIHTSFFVFFQIFFSKLLKCQIKKLIFKISIFQFEKSPNFELKNHQISNRYQKVNPITDKIISKSDFRIVLQKNSFCQRC